MTASHWHLVINHLPIIGTTLATIFLLAGIILKNKPMQVVAIGFIFVMSIFGFIAHETGEKAEHSIENTVGINESALETHEEAAKPAFIVHNITGLLSIVGLILFGLRKKAANWLAILIFISGLASAGLMSYAGYLGGKIRHQETAGSSNTIPSPQEEGENHD